jgi:DNA replication and repair protein RecF
VIKEIYLKDFRNYDEERVVLNRGINIVCGENGQGKTNLLEAIFFCMRGRSFRTAGNRDLIREGSETGVVMVKLEEDGTERNIARQICENNIVRTKVDGKERRLNMENAVVFCQDDLYVIKGDPQKRREFVDDLASELDREFKDKREQYQKALFQRNETLKRVRRGDTGRDALPAWEDILADRGSFIVRRRRETLEALAAIIGSKLREAGEGDFQIKYYGTFEDEQDYRRKFLANREKEIMRGITVVGPHRDEMLFLLNGRNLKTRGSQGQQRKTAILIKIASAEMLEEKKGKRCILLLDDMPSELDSHNTGWIMQILQEREQSIMTINPNRLEELAGANGFIHIAKGKVV